MARKRFLGRSTKKTTSKPIAGSQLKISKAQSKYLSNEDRNLHSENVLLMAETVGTAADVKKAKGFITARNKAGYLPETVRKPQQVLMKKLWPKFFGRKFGA